MALILADRILEQSVTSGTGTVSLLGAVSGYKSFANGVGNANTCYYTIYDPVAFAWEVGIGTYTLSGSTLSRNTVLSNSLNTTALISFAANTKNVFVTYPSEVAIYSNGTVIVAPTGALLPVTNGGTGVGTLTTNYIPYGNGTNPLQSSSSLTFDGTALFAPVHSNPNTITASYSFVANTNSASTGTITHTTGILTIGATSTWQVN